MKHNNWAPRGVETYESLKRLLKVIFQRIRKYLSSGETFPMVPRDKAKLEKGGAFSITTQLIPHLARLALMKEKEMKALPEFAKCTELILGDRVTQPFIPSEVDTSEYVKNEYIFPFITELIRRTRYPRFNLSTFNTLYQEIERSMYSPVHVYKAWATIENFSLSIDKVPFASNLRIRRFSQSEQEERLSEAIQPYSLTRPFDILRNSFAIEMEHSIHKGGLIALTEPMEAFGKVISALRLFKSAVIGLGPIHQKGAFWQPNVVGTLSSSIYTIPHIGPQYELTETEVSKFTQFYNWLLTIDISNERALELAIRRFNQAYERAMPVDKLIDMMISFEALLLPEKGELALRLSIRVANLLKDTDDRQETSKRMKKAYKLRSEAIHGGQIDDKEIAKCVEVLEELLRKSLRSVLMYIEQGQSLRSAIRQLDDATFT